MATSRIYLKEWSNLIKSGKKVSSAAMRPGNFYKIIVYKYSDPKQTKVLSGLSTAYIFLIGKFRAKDEDGMLHYYFPAIKLKHVNPGKFFEALKMAVDDVNEEEINEAEEFKNLLRKFPLDGKPLFNILKKKPLVYDGNYREYRLASVRSVEELEIDKEYIKVKLIPGYSNEKKLEEEKKLDKPKESPEKAKKEEKIEKVQRQREINLEPPITKIEIVKDIIDNPTTK